MARPAAEPRRLSLPNLETNIRNKLEKTNEKKNWETKTIDCLLDNNKQSTCRRHNCGNIELGAAGSELLESVEVERSIIMKDFLG